MRKSINSYVVAANAYISTNKQILSIKQLEVFVNEVRRETNDKTDYFIGGFDPTTFRYQFEFIFKTNRNNKFVFIPDELNDKKMLEGYFRERLPKDFIEILDEIGKKFVNHELEKPHDEEEKPKVLIKERWFLLPSFF